MPASDTRYLSYSLAVEQPAPDEAETFDELSQTMQHITRTMASRYRHAYRPVHAKSHGLLVGNFEVPDLPEHLAQGLFANPRIYPAILRFSTNPGDLLADSVSSPRGLAIKLLDVDGTKVANHSGESTQDLVCINADAFAAPDPKAFLKQLKLFDKNLETPEGVKHVVSLAARATNAVLKAVHLPSATLEGIGAAATHILGESFSTVAPIRFGKYIAKIGLAPASENLTELTGKGIDLGADYNALELLIKEFFESQRGVWDVKAQLALEPAADSSKKHGDEFPIERADKVWPEEKSPWQVIARLTVEPQNSYSDARQLFVDEQLSFSPWHALEEHRPLGGVMRSRLKAYEEAARYRAQRNERPKIEPRSVSEIPA